jgi:hypothetical protein
MELLHFCLQALIGRCIQNSDKCARSILSLIKNGINLISNQYDYHESIVELSIDEGKNVIVLYGQDKSSSTQRHALS